MNYIKDMVTIGLIEIPDEISLIIPVTGCGRNCQECHTPELQNKHNGESFTLDVLKGLLKRHENFISCVCFFEGDKDSEILSMCKEIHRRRLKTALYTGADRVDDLAVELFDYIKLGHYDKDLGGLSSRTSNQMLFYHKQDITYKFRERTK
jgi:anaerobic ribonucleoside-triphosphate reductase activating protein